MGRKSRRSRRRLAAHDRGIDRHHKGVSFLKKHERLTYESSHERVKRIPPFSRTHRPVDVGDGVIRCLACSEILLGKDRSLYADLPCLG